MNIEKSIEILKAFRNYNKFYKEEKTITITLEAKESIDKAIERLLTAYEKEKEENKRLRKCHYQYEEMTGIDLLLSEKEE